VKIFGKIIVKGCLTTAMVASLMLSAGCENSKKTIAAEKTTAAVDRPAELPATAYVPLDKVSPEIVFKSFPQTRLPENDSIKKTVGKFLAAGMKFQVQGNLDQAMRQYESARMYAPDSPRVLKALGMIWMAKREYEKAANYFRMSLDVDPDDLQVQVNLGRVYLMQDKPEEALYCFRAALRTKQAKPDNIETAYAALYRSRLLEKLGYYTAALQSYDYFETLVRQNWASYQKDSVIGDFILKPERFMIARGNIYDLLRQPQKALEEYKKALARDRNAVKVGIKIFEIYVQTGDIKNAEKLLLEFAMQEDYSSYMDKLAVILCEKSHDENQPLRLWKEFRRHNAMSIVFAFAMAEAADAIHAWPQEKTILTDIINMLPDAPQAAEMLAELAIKTGHPEECMEQMAGLIVNNTKAFDNVSAAMEIISQLDDAGLLLDKFSQIPAANNLSIQAGRNYVAAILAAKLQQADRSNRLLEEAIKIDPKFSPAYVSLLQPQWIRQNSSKTDEYVKRMKANTVGQDYFYVLGEVELARGNYSAAVASLLKARELDESSEPVIMKLSQAYELEARKTTDSTKAAQYNQNSEELLQTAIELRPDKLEAYRRLFEKYVNRLDTRDAADIAIQVIKNSPQSPEGRIMAAETYLIANNRSRAKIIIDDLIKNCPDDPQVSLLQIRFTLGEHEGLISKKSFDTNYAAIKRLIANHPDFVPAYELAGRLLGMAMPADYDEAVKYYGQAYRLAPNDFSCAREYVLAMLRAGDYKTALPLAETLLAESPRSITLRQAIISCLDKMGDDKKALQYLDAWHKAAPSNKTYIEWILKLYVKGKQYGQAVKMLDSLSEVSGFPQTWIADRKFDLYMSNNDFKNAFEIVKQEQLSDVMRSMILLMDAMANAKKYDQALKFIDELRTVGKENETRARQLSGLRYYILSKADRLSEFMADFSKEKPTPAVCAGVYAALMSGKHYDEALKLLDKWQIKESFSPDDTEKTQINSWCREMIVATYLAQSDYDKASKALQDSMATDGEKSWYYYYNATVLMHNGENDDAVLMLQKALNEDPKNAMLKNDLAYQLAVIGRDLKNAEKLARECLQAKGFEPAYMDTLAWVFFKDNQPGRAGEILLKVVPSPEKINAMLAKAKDENRRLDAEEINPVIVGHLGDVLAELGWTNTAREYWQAAIDLAQQWPTKTDDIKLMLKDASAKLKK